MEEKILEVVSFVSFCFFFSKCEIVDRVEKVRLLSFRFQQQGQFSEKRRADESIGLPTKGEAVVRLGHQSVLPVADGLRSHSASSAVPSVP